MTPGPEDLLPPPPKKTISSQGDLLPPPPKKKISDGSKPVITLTDSEVRGASASNGPLKSTESKPTEEYNTDALSPLPLLKKMVNDDFETKFDYKVNSGNVSPTDLEYLKENNPEKYTKIAKDNFPSSGDAFLKSTTGTKLLSDNINKKANEVNFIAAKNYDANYYKNLDGIIGVAGQQVNDVFAGTDGFVPIKPTKIPAESQEQLKFLTEQDRVLSQQINADKLVNWVDRVQAGAHYQVSQPRVYDVTKMSDAEIEATQSKSSDLYNRLIEAKAKVLDASKKSALIHQTIAPIQSQLGGNILAESKAIKLPDPNKDGNDYVRHIGEEIYKTSNPEKYALYQAAGGYDKTKPYAEQRFESSLDKINKEIMTLGYNALRGDAAANGTDSQYANIYDNLKYLDYKFSTPKEQETKHMIAAALKNEGINPDDATTEQKDAIASTLPLENQQIWYNKTKASGHTDLPSTGFLYSTGKSGVRTMENVLKSGSIASPTSWATLFLGVPTKKEKAQEILRDEMVSDVLGENPESLQRYSYLRQREKDKTLTPQEQLELNDLSQYTDIRTGWDRFKDGNGNMVGMMAAITVDALPTLGGGMLSKSITGGTAALVGENAAAKGITDIPLLENTAAKTAQTLAERLNIPRDPESIINFAKNKNEMFVLMHHDNAKKAMELFPDDDAKKSWYTGITDVISVALPNILPTHKLGQLFNTESKDIVAGLVAKLDVDNLDKAVVDNLMKKTASDIIEKSGTFLYGAEKAAAETSLTMSLMTLGNNITQAVLKPDSISGQDIADNFTETFSSTFLDSQLVGLIGGHGAVQKKYGQIGVDAIYDATNNSNTINSVKYTILDQKSKGELTEQQANNKISILNTATELRQPVNDLQRQEGLTPNASKRVFINLLNERILKANIKKLEESGTSESLIKPSQNRIEEINRINEKIIGKEVYVNDDYSIIDKETKLKQDAEKIANAPKQPEEKTFTDFDKTLFHEGKLTKLGEEMKQRIANGEDITILTSRENTPENIKFISETLGIPEEKIKAGLDAEGKAAELTAYNGKKVFYDDNPDNVAAAQKTDARVIDTGITSDEARVPDLFKELQATGEVNEYLHPEKIPESIDEIQSQALTAPGSLKGRIGEKLTLELISRNTVEDINKAIESWQKKVSGEEVSATETKEADRHIRLLEKGLEEKARINEAPKVEGKPEEITQPIELSTEVTKPTDVVVDAEQQSGKENPVLKDVESTTEFLKNNPDVVEKIVGKDFKGTVESLAQAYHRGKEMGDNKDFTENVERAIGKQQSGKDGVVDEGVGKADNVFEFIENSGFKRDEEANDVRYNKDGVTIGVSPNKLNPINKGSEMIPKGEKGFTINIIATDQSVRGKGEASKALKEITDYADKNGETIYLSANDATIGFKKGLNKKQLEDWYGRHGFEKVESIMVRKPKEQSLKETTKAEPLTSNVGGGKPIEKKNTGTEIEPELGDGRKPVTLSGSTESERQVAIEQRKKETKQTPMTESRDKLLERIQKYNKLSRSEKRQAYIEANKIKLAVDNFNNTHEQKHSLSTNRDGSLELRNNPTEKRASGKPIKNTLKGNENAIVDNGKPLMERDDNTKKVFQDLLDADVLPISRRVNGERMSEAEHDATIQDIMDGIPSQRADNYLNSLEKQIREDHFDFGNPDKNARVTLNDALNISVEKGEPMTPESIEKWLGKESELTPEEQTTFDNIDNLITHYEQLHESENGTPAKVQQPAGKGQESNSGKANENGQPKSETSTANKKEPIKNEEPQASEVVNPEKGGEKEIRDKIISAAEGKKSVKAKNDAMEAEAEKHGEVGKKILADLKEAEPLEKLEEKIKEKQKEEAAESRSNKALAVRLVNAKNTPEAAREGIKAEGLEYEPQSQKEAKDLAKSIIDELGMDESVLQAQAGKFGGDVNTLVQTESLNKLAELSGKETDKTKQLEYDLKFAEIGIGLDKSLRSKGQSISAINYFYKKSPLGIQIMENIKRKEDFERWAKPKEQSWKEAFEEMMKEPEFEQQVKDYAKEEMRKERAENRANRIKKVDEFFDKAKEEFKGGAAYSTIIPPKVITAALEGMKQAYHAGEKVAEIVQKAIDYISEQLGHDNWDKDKFRNEWQQKLKDSSNKKLTDEEVKAKILDRFRNKLKGLTDRQKEDVVRKSFQKIVENGGLDYADFRAIIAEVTGRGSMTDAEAARLRELVKETNAVDEAGERARTERTQEARKAFREAEVKAGKAQKELNTLLYNRPNITKRLTSLMQLNTLGIPALINNPIYNVVNQLGLRTPVGLVKTGIDAAIYGVAKAFGKEVLPETNILSRQVQKEFFRKLGLGTRESIGQFLTGLNRQDYIQKEIHAGQQIRPATAYRDLWAYSKGEKNLTKKQIIDKVIQASPPGITAEIIARTLNLGDKPQRFAAEGAQAAAFAKSLGLKDIDYDLFIDFPREEAYRAYKAKGFSDAEAAKQADYIKDTIVKEGERSTFQQDNMLNDALSKVFGGKGSGVGELVKATVVSPYIKIPTNAYWSYYNIVNPEVAMLQSMIYAGKAWAKNNGAKFSFDKSNSSAAKDLNEAKYWFAHAAVGVATRAVIVSLVSAGIFRPANTGDDTKKEREGEQFYENQGTLNMSKLWAVMKGEDPGKVKNGLVINNRWFGHWGTVGNTIARKYEDMTPEQKANQSEFWDRAVGGMELFALQDFEQGVFGNTSSLLQAMNQGIKTGDVGYGIQAWGVNTVNMFTNIVHPAASAQIERAVLPYYTKQKADTFMGELKNTMLSRSAVLRNLTGEYPPSKTGIWGDRLDKKDNWLMNLFGISHNNPDNFAQPIYEDYKKTNNTKFFPPAVMPVIVENGERIKLPVADAAKLEELVGHQRKALVAPYVNNMAKFEGSNKTYSQLTEDEKLDKLRILYDEGYKNGKYLFLKQNPQYKVPEPSQKEKQSQEKESDANEIFRESLKSKSPIKN